MAVPGVPILHLWILISEPDPDTSIGIMVSVTTLRRGHDQTVILQPGDHPYIIRPSAVYFGDARLFDTRKIERDVLCGYVRRLERFSPSLISELQQGILVSPYTSNKMLHFCRRAFAEAAE
jgi:hypothetical protein